jgi:hypothetical protein
MGIRLLYIGRQALITILALQLLNISIGSQPNTDADYDYSYSYNKTYDPTETAVEWIVEMECGQQARFSYTNHTDTGKSLQKSFHWQATTPVTTIQPPHYPQPLIIPYTCRSEKLIPAPIREILTPPPQQVA